MSDAARFSQMAAELRSLISKPREVQETKTVELEGEELPLTATELVKRYGYPYHVVYVSNRPRLDN